MGCGASSEGTQGTAGAGAPGAQPVVDVKAEMDDFGKPTAIPMSAVSALEKPADDDSSGQMETVIESKLKNPPKEKDDYDKNVDLNEEETEQLKEWMELAKGFDSVADFDADFDAAMNAAEEVYRAFKALPPRVRVMNKVIDQTWNIAFPLGAAVIARMDITVNTPQVEIDRKYMEIFNQYPWYGPASGELRRVKIRERVRGKAYEPYNRLCLDQWDGAIDYDQTEIQTYIDEQEHAQGVKKFLFDRRADWQHPDDVYFTDGPAIVDYINETLGEIRYVDRVTQKSGFLHENNTWGTPQNYVDMKVFSEGVDPNDIMQGYIGNCWMVSTIATVAKWPQLIEQAIYPNTFSPSGCYAVRVCCQCSESKPKDVRWAWIIVDSIFPRDERGQTACANSRDHLELWPMLLEKALAKFHGSYSLMVGGGEGKPVGYGGLLMALTGGPWYWMTIGKELKTDTKVSDYLRWMRHKAQRMMVVSCTAPREEKETLGLVGHHAYSILGIHSIFEDDNEIHLVELRNPWGWFEWKGKWSNHDWQNWMTNQRHNQVARFRELFDWDKIKETDGKEGMPKDGQFYMECKDFMKYFSTITVVKVPFKFDEETLRDVAGWLGELKKLDKFSSKVKTVLDEATELFAEGARLGSAGHGGFGASWCEDLKHRLQKLKPGQLFLAPGGWRHNKGGHAIIYLFQRISDSEYKFAVCNTGEGVNDHPEDAGAGVFPKEKRVTSWLLKGIPPEKILDELWLYSLFKIYYTKADHHKPVMLYECLLPLILPSGNVREQTDMSWSTPATCQRAGSCYYKCIPAALRLILGLRGVEEPDRKLLMYFLRLGQVSRIHQALKDTQLEALTESDFMVVECACRQMAQKVLYQKSISSDEKESARRLIAEVDGKVAEAREVQRQALAAKAVGISRGVPEDFVGYSGFPGWELLSVPWFGHGNKDAYTHLMGSKDSLSPGQHVDIAALREMSGYDLIFETTKVCDKLENNGLEEISKLRIGALIEDVMIRQFPPGHEDWKKDFDLETQKRVLKDLWRLTQHYVAAVASSTTARTQVGAQILTIRSLHAAFETCLRRAAEDGSMLPTTQAIICPVGGDDPDTYRLSWSFTGVADFQGKSADSATDGLPLSTPELAKARDALARHEAGGAAKGDGAWDSSLNGLKYDATALKPTQSLVTDLTKKVLKIMSNVLPPNHSDEWPKWTIPFGWALNSSGEIKTKAPEFYFWRDICVWSKYLCLDPQCRRFKGVFTANSVTITWRVSYCKPCEILKAQPSALNGTIKFDQLSKGFTTISGASLQAAGLEKAISEDDVIHAPTLPTFGQALAQEEAEHVLSALTTPYLRIPLLLHFLAADRLHALKQTSMQEMLWAALMEPAIWADDEKPKPVQHAPEQRAKLGTSFGLLHNEVINGLSTIAAPFCALCAQADELAGLAPPEEFDGPPAEILQFFVRLCSRFLDQLYNQGMDAREPDLTRTLKTFLEEKAVKHLRRWITASTQEMDVRCRLHAHMALTCLQRDVSDADNLILLLSSCSYVMAWYERDFSDTFGTELQMVFEVVQRRRVEVIAAVNDSPKRKYILDQAAKITSNFFTSDADEWNAEKGSGTWKCDKKGGAAVFNLQTCTLWLESGLLRPIPPKLQRTPQFAEFFRMHPVKLQPTCRPLRLARNCHMLSAVDDDSKAFELQWWSSVQQQNEYVSAEDDQGLKWKASGSCTGVAMPWKQDDQWRLPGGIVCELQDVPSWLKGQGKDELAEVWERLLTFAQDPGNDDEGEALGPLMNSWYCQTNQLNTKELVAVQHMDRQGILEARFACEGHAVIRVFTHSDFGRHSFRSQVFCSDAAFSYASLVPNDLDREERPLCNPQFAGKIGFLVKDETLAILDDSKRLWVPPVALQGLLPAVLLEGCRFWAEEKHGVVSFTGKPYNPPVYNTLNYTLQVTCENGLAKVTRQVGDKTWVLASPIHAPSGSQIERFAAILGPLEAMSHTLFWTDEEGSAVCLVELPRVQLRFVPGPDPNNRGLRLFSKEFGGFYLLNRRGVFDPEAWQEATGDPRATDLAAFLAKMPHAVVLRSAAGAIRILVTSADVTRPNIKCKPFSTDLVVNRKILVALSGKTFLWDFHESGSLLLTSSLSGTLYLSLLTLLHRDYTACARLIGSVGFDEGISAEEFRLLKMTLFSTMKDRHPDASALRLKLVLALIAHNPKHPLLDPDNKLIQSDYGDYLLKLTHISQSCQLQLREEGVLLRNMQEMGCESWQQADNRFKFVEAVQNGSPACVLRYGSRHPAARREGLLGYQNLQRNMEVFTKNRWYENFTVDMKDEGNNRTDLESLVQLMDRCDREDWTCSGTLFFTLYAILTGTSKVTLNGKDVTKRFVRLVIEKFWLRVIRLAKNPSGDDMRVICTLWSVLGMNAMGTTGSLPPWHDAAKLYKESKYGCMIGHDESCGLTFLNDLHKALESGFSCAETLVPQVTCHNDSHQDKLTISEEAMPRFSPPCAPRLTDFAKGSCGLEGEAAEVLSMLSQPLKFISDKFMSEFEESLNIPDCPFSEKRLSGLPGGMTRMGAGIIKGKLDGHAVFLDRSKKKKGFGLKCLPQVPDEAALESSLETLNELEAELKRCWSHDLEKVASLRKELLKKADFAPEDKGEGTLFWLGRRGGIEGHLWLEWCIGSELDSVREFVGCIAAVNKVVNKGTAAAVGRGVLGLMLHVNRVAQAQLVLGCVQDLRGAVKRTKSKGIDEVACKELQTLAGRVAMFLGCLRNYTTSSPEISPAFLLFEYVTGFMVRKQQVDLIRRFAEEAFAGRSLVAQMIMGAGKTTCIAPMLTLLLGNNGRLVLNIVPRALLAQTRNVMRTMFGQILAKRVVTLEFSRMMGQDDPFDVKLVKMQLFDAQRDAAVVCTTPAAIKSMFLRHLELLQLNHILSSTMEGYKTQMKKATDSVSQTRIKKRMDDVNKDVNGNRVMAGFIGDVLGMLRNNSCALIDEVDLVLHPLKSELNFPIGSFEMYDLGCERWHLAVHLLDALFLNDEGHAAAGIFYPDIRNCTGKVGSAAAERISQLEIEIPDIMKKGYDLLTLQKQPHLVLLSRAWYDKNLLRPLADWLACWIVTRAEARKFREGVEYSDVCEFLSIDLSDLLKSDVKSKVESKADNTIGKLLCLGREWLFQLVPHVISKVNRVQYGLLTQQELALVENQKAPSSRRLLAVPFVAKDKPSPAAEFAQPDVLIGFTVLAYRYEGMRLSDTVSMLHHLQMKSGRESGPWSARPTCVLFERWKAIGTKRYKEKGGKSSVEGLGPLNWEVSLNDGWQKLPSDITELLREAVAKKETKVKFSGFGAQPYEIDLEKMVQVNLRSKKARNIRQVQESSKRGEGLKLPELQALSSSTGDEEAKKKKDKEKKEKESGGEEAASDPLLRGPEAVEEKPEGHAQVAVELLGPVPEIVLWYLLTMVFDAVLRQQPYKLSATGQELGSSMLFSSRIGFSGTPSSLLPEDLGECLFEAENEGEILSVLSDEQHVVPPLIHLASDWSPESILNMVAKSTDPVYHCLIDTGALVMGFTNEEVAKLLLKLLPDDLFDGVAYFDDRDAPMVILRNAVKPALLSEAGVPMNRRFTFFDQVHTTGTDTKQPLQSYAALTLSASMTFRDYAQGAWRMRGLGKGQKLRMIIAPELAKKVSGIVKAEGELGLHDAVAFMLSNQFDSEGKQFAALQLQNLATVWRQHALNDLMEKEVKVRESKEMRPQVEAFLESLRFPVETKVHEPLTLDQKMQAQADEQEHIMNDKEKAHCAKLIGDAGGSKDGGDLGAEITRQQEKEQEKQQEKEKEVEVHVGREREREARQNPFRPFYESLASKIRRCALDMIQWFFIHGFLVTMFGFSLNFFAAAMEADKDYDSPFMSEASTSAPADAKDVLRSSSSSEHQPEDGLPSVEQQQED
eukprot:s652_g10.t2